MFNNPIYVNLFLTVGLLVVSFLLGGYLSRAIRMADYGWKLSVIILATLASAVVVYRGWPPKLGVDLGGGVILVYQVDPEKIPKEGFDIQKLISSVGERVNPGGQKEITVRPLGNDKIQITIPQVGEEEARRIKSIISRAGTLEFRILANLRDDRSVIERAQNEPNHKELKDSNGDVMAWWVPVSPKEAASFQGDTQVTTRPSKSGGLEVLVKYDPYSITGSYLKQAAPSTDQQGRPAVSFTFNTTGGQLFGRLTGDHLPRDDFKYRLGIILDGELYSAPSINSTIFDRGEITGRFTRAEVDDLVKVLNAGSLPAALKKDPVRDLTTGPTLGGDTIQKSRDAMVISSILVPLFMLWYYRFAGLVANLALVLNMLLLVAVMILVKAPFTLPALAGLALTIGMAVDNNVLIYERLREELHHGAALRMAIRNAFHRAGVVIIDANCTHLIAATVLFVVGTEQVRGFAVTFWLGAVLSIWATMFVARVMFEIAERRQWITKVKMMHIIGHTEFDFMHWFPVTATISVVVTVLGLLIAFHRGVGLFDIDFTGGVSVQTVFTEAQDIGDIRKKVAHLPDVAVSNVQIQGEKEGGRFLIDTSESDLEKVKLDLKGIFGDKLIANEMKYAALTTIASTPQSTPGQKPEPKPEAKPQAKPEAKPQAKAGAKPEPKPEAKPQAKPEAKPASPNKQSRRSDLPPDTMVAMAGPDAVLVALADTPPKPATAASKPAEAKPAETKPAATKPAEAKPAATKPAEAKPAEAKPAAAQEKPATMGAFQKPGEKASPAADKASMSAPSQFEGGTEAELKFQYKVDHRTVEEMVKTAMKADKISADTPLELTNSDYVDRDTTPYDHWTLRIKLQQDKVKTVLASIQQQVKEMPYFPDVDAIGGAVASDTRYYAVIALVASWVLIILYLWIRFQGVAFGLAAVIALIHDVLVMLGALAFSYYVPTWLGVITLIEPFKINLPIVAAFMTIIGYSVNDTIVVFDRIREIRGKDPRITREMVNDATNQTLSRTLLTSFTVLLVVVILYVFGGQAVHGFAFSLLAGVVTGTYSSIYVAAPILLWLVHPKEMKRRVNVAEIQKTRGEKR